MVVSSVQTQAVNTHTWKNLHAWSMWNGWTTSEHRNLYYSLIKANASKLPLVLYRCVIGSSARERVITALFHGHTTHTSASARMSICPLRLIAFKNGFDIYVLSMSNASRDMVWRNLWCGFTPVGSALVRFRKDVIMKIAYCNFPGFKGLRQLCISLWFLWVDSPVMFKKRPREAIMGRADLPEPLANKFKN